MIQIVTNTNAMFSARQLTRTENALAQSLQRLSSGLRINSAKDDAAGMAISERMTSQFRGGNQAIRNANDAISLLQTAEGAMTTVDDAIQRIRELAVQSANATNSASDRIALQTEANQLISEITRIGDATVFNGEKIFAQGTDGIGGDANQRAVADGLKLGWLTQSEKMIEDYFGILGLGEAMHIGITQDSDGEGGWLAYVSWPSLEAGYFQDMQLDIADFTPPNLPDGGDAPVYNDRIIAHEMVHAVMNSAFGTGTTGNTPKWFLEGAAELIHGGDERVAAVLNNLGGVNDANIRTMLNTLTGAWGNSSAEYAAGYVATRLLHDTLKDHGHTDGIKALMTHMAANPAGAATLDNAINTLTDGAYADAAAFIASFTGGDLVTGNVRTGVAYVNSDIKLTNTDTGAVGGLDADGGPVKTAESVVGFGSPTGAGVDPENLLRGFKVNIQQVGGAGTAATRHVSFQIGADAGQTLQVGIGAMSAGALGLESIDISTGTGATIALTHLDEALDYVNLQRANIGAQLNRLEFTIANLQNTTQNIAASRSRIQDADFAIETANLVRQQILQQAATGIIAQAQASSQMALQLLR